MDKSGSSDHGKQWLDKGNILEVEPIEVADKLNEWVVIQKKRQNEDNICIWGFNNWVLASYTGMENAVWSRFSGENIKNSVLNMFILRFLSNIQVRYIDTRAWSPLKWSSVEIQI